MPQAETPPEALERLRTEPAQTALLLDIDGTLAPIVRHASDARVSEATRSLLIAASRRFGLVACVTGRRAGDARRIVGIGTITYVGGHGSELLAAGGTTVEVDPELLAWRGRIHDFSLAAMDGELRRLRVRVEDKEAITAFHWRGVPDERAAQAKLELVAEQAVADGLTVHWGRKVLEVRPPIEISKGVAVARLLAGAKCLCAVYVGDDGTDADAFRALHALRDEGQLEEALCVAVRSDEAPRDLIDLADVTVAGTDGVRELLQALQ